MRPPHRATTGIAERLKSSKKEALPHHAATPRQWARELLGRGERYREVLTGIAHMVVVREGAVLTRRRATLIKKGVEREFRMVRGEEAPKSPRGWWYPVRVPVSGGARLLSLTWMPRPGEQ